MTNKILSHKHLILIDKYNKDYSELETELTNYNKSGLAKPKTMHKNNKLREIIHEI